MFSEITRNELRNLGTKISEGLNEDGLKWLKSFTSKVSANAPKNAITQKNYQGLNWWNLGFEVVNNDYATNNFATKKAWQNVGATIKPDHSKNGTQVFYWGQMSKKVEDKKGDEKTKNFRFLNNKTNKNINPNFFFPYFFF